MRTAKQQTDTESKHPTQPRNYCVYIVECADGTLYTGITNNLQKRFALHRAGKASRYTRARGVMRMTCIARRMTRSNALKREAATKKLSRAQKCELIATSQHMQLD